MRAEGRSGKLFHGYAVAASLDHWVLEAHPTRDDTFTVRANMRADDFLVARMPLRLVLEVGTVHWTWDDARIIGGRIVVEGRPLEGVVVLDGT